MAPRRRRPGGDPGGRPNPDHPGNGDGKGGGKKPPRRKSPEFKDARRDVMNSIRPIRHEIRRVRKQGIQDSKQAAHRVSDIYGALGSELGGLTAPYAEQTGQIASGLQTSLADLASMLGSNVQGVPQSEIGAGAGLFGSIGAGGLQGLASQTARNVAYNTSAQRQGAEESGIARRNLITDRQNFTQDLGQQRIDLLRDVPSLIRSRMDELHSRNFQEDLANREFQLRARSMNQDQLANDAAAQASQAYMRWIMNGGG